MGFVSTASCCIPQFGAQISYLLTALLTSQAICQAGIGDKDTMLCALR